MFSILCTGKGAGGLSILDWELPKWSGTLSWGSQTSGFIGVSPILSISLHLLI